MQPPDGRGSFESPDNASDDASHFYFLLPSAKVGCHPAPFWLGAAAMTLIFFFLGFLASRLLLCWPLAMSISFGLRMTQGDGVFFVWDPSVQHNDLDGLTDAKRLARNSAALDVKRPMA
jgi:hypothetical protein